jgi:DNA-binding HxlR family transcriptional regulator
MKLEKVTKNKSDREKRWYDDACGTAHALELVGERWSLLIVRELMFGPRRFGDLRASLPGISANVLTQRLEGLEAAGILLRRRLEPPASVQVYELTPWGYEAEPIFQALGRWAARSPRHDPTLPLSATSLILSFRTMFDPRRAQGLDATLCLRLGGQGYGIRIGGGRLEAGPGGCEGAALVLTGEPSTVAAAVYGGVPVEQLEAGGLLRVDGDRSQLARFLSLFPLPPKAEAPASTADAG